MIFDETGASGTTLSYVLLCSVVLPSQQKLFLSSAGTNNVRKTPPIPIEKWLILNIGVHSAYNIKRW